MQKGFGSAEEGIDMKYTNNVTTKKSITITILVLFFVLMMPSVSLAAENTEDQPAISDIFDSVSGFFDGLFWDALSITWMSIDVTSNKTINTANPLEEDTLVVNNVFTEDIKIQDDPICEAPDGYNCWYVRPHGYPYTGKLDGTSIEDAFYGVNAVVWGSGGVQAGDMLILCRQDGDPENFTRTLSIQASGTATEQITIESLSSDTPETIISAVQINYPGIPGYDPAKPSIKGNYALGGTEISYINIRNINIKNCYGAKFVNCHNMSIQNMNFENVCSAVLLEGGSNITVANCEIQNFVNAGIGLIGTNPETTTPVRDCTIHGNEISGSLEGDGITLHLSSDVNSYDIGQGNRVIDNIAFNNQEEGLDITAGANTWIEGNEMYNNSRSVTIAHMAQNVTFVRNYAHNESGILVHPSVSEGSTGNIILAYNIIDSENNSALIISENSNYYVYNNIFRSAGQAVKPATVDIRYEVDNVSLKNNIIIATEPDGYLLRMAYYTPMTKNYVFDHNCWWQPSGADAETFYDVEKGSYNFSVFKTYPSVIDTLFSDPLFADNSGSYLEVDDFRLQPDSPAIDAGVDVNRTQDFEGNPVPYGSAPDIGAYEYTYHKADTNNDNQIDMPELMAFISRWKANSIDVSKAEVEDARNIWFGGGGC